jgi:hypothetical protein
MLSYQDLLLHQARYKELVSQAKKERLLQQALAKSEQRNGLHCRVLSWLGSRLVAWGHSLQERYSMADMTPQKSA